MSIKNKVSVFSNRNLILYSVMNCGVNVQICGLGGRPRTGKGDRRTTVEGEIVHSKKPLIERFVMVFQPFPQRALGPLPCLGTASVICAINNNLPFTAILF